MKYILARVSEATALGAAYLTGLGVGFWRDQNEIAAQWQSDRSFKPTFLKAQRKKLQAG